MFKKFAGLAVVAIILTACGGGGGGSSGGSGGGGSSSSSSSNSSPIPLSVALASSSGSAWVYGNATQTTLTTTATVSGTLPTAPVVDIQYDKTVFAGGSAVAGSTPGTYTISAQTISGLADGEYKGNITFRLCQDAACTNVYAGSTVTYAYILVVGRDWVTTNGNAARTGYVAQTIDPASLNTAAWSYAPQPISIRSIATANGQVYVSRVVPHASGGTTIFSTDVVALKAADGTTQWSLDLGTSAGPGDLAVLGGTVFVQHWDDPSGTDYSFIDGLTGTSIKGVVAAGVVTKTAPAPLGDAFHTIQGISFGKDLAAAYKTDGSVKWQQTGTASVNHSDGVSADNNYVYTYSNDRLNVFNRLTGVSAYSIADLYPAPSTPTVGRIAPPVLGKNGKVFVQPTGIVNSNTSHVNAFDTATKTELWTSASGVYTTTIAYANGVVYAGTSAPARLDALDEATGAVLWSWMPSDEDGASASDTLLAGKIVVTKNLLFVSSSRKLYAVDLATHATIWKYSKPAQVFIGSNNMLYYIVSSFIPGIGMDPYGAMTAVKFRPL